MALRTLKRAEKEKRMATSKKRQVKRKARRLAHEQLMNIVRKEVKHNRTWANVVALRREKNADGPETVFGMRTGLFGHPTTTVLRLPDEKLVGAVEDHKELGEIVTQLGLLTMAALFNYNLALGPDGLAKAVCKWARIDLEALKKQAEEEAAREAADLAAQGKEAVVDEDGDIVVQPIEPDVVKEPETPAAEVTP